MTVIQVKYIDSMETGVLYKPDYPGEPYSVGFTKDWVDDPNPF